jgi:hypothetical protein
VDLGAFHVRQTRRDPQRRYGAQCAREESLTIAAHCRPRCYTWRRSTATSAILKPISRACSKGFTTPILTLTPHSPCSRSKQSFRAEHWYKNVHSHSQSYSQDVSRQCSTTRSQLMRALAGGRSLELGGILLSTSRMASRRSVHGGIDGVGEFVIMDDSRACVNDGLQLHKALAAAGALLGFQD